MFSGGVVSFVPADELLSRQVVEPVDPVMDFRIGILGMILDGHEAHGQY